MNSPVGVASSCRAGANVMTKIERFDDGHKAQQFARQYAQHHRVTTQVVRDQDAWIVQAATPSPAPAQLELLPATPAVAQPTSQTPKLDASQLPAEEQQRRSHFELVEQLLAIESPEERERRLDALCSTWGGRLQAARQLLRELTGQPQVAKSLSGRLRRRLRGQGIHQLVPSQPPVDAPRAPVRPPACLTSPPWANTPSEATSGSSWIPCPGRVIRWS